MPRQRLKKRSDGRYLCKADGRTFYGYTEREAKEKRAAYLLEKSRGLDADQANITVDAYAQKWLPIYRAASCEKSYTMYGGILDDFIEFLPYGIRMRDVKKTHIVAFYNTLADYSPSHISKHVVTIHGMFEAAKEDGIIVKDPTFGVEPPQGVEGRYAHRPLEDWERDLVHAMLTVEYKANGKTYHGHPFAPAAMAMLYQGLRKGEALAFDIDRDVDLDAGRVYVREALSFSETHRGRIEDPKTKKGVRDLPLFQPFREAITGMHGRLVKSIHGGPVTDSVFDSMWKSYKYQMAVLHNNGIQRRWAADGEFEDITIRTHDFRHSFVTMLCDAGVDIKTAMTWVGHADEKMIRQIYDHVTRQREKLAEQNTARMIEKMMDKNSSSVHESVQKPE